MSWTISMHALGRRTVLETHEFMCVTNLQTLCRNDDRHVGVRLGVLDCPLVLHVVRAACRSYLKSAMVRGAGAAAGPASTAGTEATAEAAAPAPAACAVAAAELAAAACISARQRHTVSYCAAQQGEDQACQSRGSLASGCVQLTRSCLCLCSWLGYTCANLSAPTCRHI